MKSTPSILLISLFFTVSCVSEQEIEAVNIISQLYQTENVNIQYGYDMDTKGSEGKFVALYISESQVINSPDYNVFFAASNSARILYEFLTPEQIEDYNLIRVNVEQTGSNKTEMTFDYPLVYLKSVQQIVPEIINFLNHFKNNEIKKMSDMMAQEIHEQIPKEEMLEWLSNMNSDIGPLNKFELVGFRFSEGTLNNSTTIPVIEFWCVNYHEQGNATTSFVFSSDTTSKQILGFHWEAW